MTNTEILHTLSRMMAGLREYHRCTEITYEANGWKTCHQMQADGSVITLYRYPGEPKSLFPLKVSLFGLGRSNIVTVQPEEIFTA